MRSCIAVAKDSRFASKDRRLAFRGAVRYGAESEERTWKRALADGKSDWSCSRLGAGAFGEAADRGGFGVVDVEDGEQLGDLQHFLELAAQMAEL